MITNEEAIRIIEKRKPQIKATSISARRTNEALEMAISALKDRPTATLDEIKAEIDREYEELDGYDPSSLGTFAEKVDDILDKYKAEDRPKREWIPVSERLPDNNVRVLCSAISTSISGGYTRFVGCCNNGFWFVQTDAETVSYPRQYEVIAWQSLPEPYKAESEDI